MGCAFLLEDYVSPSATIRTMPDWKLSGLFQLGLSKHCVQSVQCLQQQGLSFKLWKTTKDNCDIPYCLGRLLYFSDQQLMGRVSMPGTRNTSRNANVDGKLHMISPLDEDLQMINGY